MHVTVSMQIVVATGNILNVALPRYELYVGVFQRVCAIVLILLLPIAFIPVAYLTG